MFATLISITLKDWVVAGTCQRNRREQRCPPLPLFTVDDSAGDKFASLAKAAKQGFMVPKKLNGTSFFLGARIRVHPTMPLELRGRPPHPLSCQNPAAKA